VNENASQISVLKTDGGGGRNRFRGFDSRIAATLDQGDIKTI
jgi:hypothetical protein